MKTLEKLSRIFLILAGIAWGFIGLYHLNLVEYIVRREWVVRLIYVLFGLGGAYYLVSLKFWKKNAHKK